MATITITEDHPFVREGVRAYIERHTHHEVIDECKTGVEAIASVNRMTPDVLIIDLRIPELDGLEVIRRVHRDHPLVAIIVLSMHAGPAYVTRAIRYGARGYLLKNSDVQVLATAIESVLNGGTYFSSSVSQYLCDEGDAVDLYDSLTGREREILQLVAEGRSASEIKDLLFISVRTVEKHRSNMMKKLDFHHHSEIIRYALQRGLIPLIEPGSDA